MNHNEIPLERLIRMPVQWANFFTEQDAADRMMDLLDALVQLPESGIRAARISRCLMRLGRFEEARSVLLAHANEPLCVAWYVISVVQLGGEQELRQVLSTYHPNQFAIDENTTTLEAKFRLHLGRGIAFSTLRMKEAARFEFQSCLVYANALGDQTARRTVEMEMARSEMMNNSLEAAFNAYAALASELPSCSIALDNCMENLVGLSWLLGQQPEVLNDWGGFMLAGLRLQRPNVPIPRFPEDVELVRVISVLEKLQQLTRDFNANLPLFYSHLNRKPKDRLAHSILSATAPIVSDELTAFVMQVARGLTMSMMHDPAGVEVVKGAMKGPVNGISVLVMAHFAAVIQVYANFPHVEQDSIFINAKRTLLGQFKHVKGGQRDWLVWWMQKFCPVALYVLTRSHPALSDLQGDFLVVGPKRKLRGYPKKFMSDQVLHLLAGEAVPVSQRMQAIRHRRFLEAHGHPYVIVESLMAKLDLPT